MNNSHFGFYRGMVVQQLSNGFCKISIPGVLHFVDADGELDIAKLPPAECASETFGGTFGNGTFKYPDLYSCVWCFFEGGNVNKPVYFACATSNSPTWNISTVAVPTTQTIPGYDITPVTGVGKCSKFGDSMITQTSTIDPTTRKTINSTIKLDISRTPADAEKQAAEISKDKDLENGSPRGSSVTVTLDNANNKLTLYAASTIEIIAPEVIINGTKLGSPSSVKINSTKIELNSSDTTTLINNSLTNKSTEVMSLTSKTAKLLYI